MKNSESQYKNLRKKQLFIVLIGVIAIFLYLYLALRDGWPVQVTYAVVPALGILLYFSVKNITLPILCSSCKRDMTAVYNDSELKSYDVLFCPYCGSSVKE